MSPRPAGMKRIAPGLYSFCGQLHPFPAEICEGMKIPPTPENLLMVQEEILTTYLEIFGQDAPWAVNVVNDKKVN